MMKRMTALMLILCQLAGCLAALGEGDMIGLDDDGVVIEETVDARVMAQGDEGADVKELQTYLAKLGYYTGSISGSYGAATKAAVQAFQSDFELEPTGVADIETQAMLFATNYRPVGFGASGEDVKRIQTRLTKLGYYTGKISGNYLAGTQDAVRLFQTRMAVDVTGECDVGTLALLFSDSALSRSGTTLMPDAAATPAPEVGDNDILEVSDGDDGTVNTDEAVPFKKKLSYNNSSGPQVKLLQQRLKDLGYYEGNISGNFLGNTRNAVKAFQKQNALKADGVVGEETWNAIFNDPEVVYPGDTPKPTATPVPVPFHIVVDVTNQVVTVYGRDEAGEYTVVVRQMICSTGTRKNPSDVGDWVLSGRKTKWCYFPKWGDYARYWTKINSSIAFHSVIYNSVDTMDLSVKSYKNLGNRASHGCVRLTVADAKWVYDNVPAGVVVTITEKLPADPELRASVKIPALNYKTMLPYSTPEPTAEPVYVSGALPPMPLTKLQKNDSSEAVFWLQKKLTELGYYTGKVSGTYLDGTANAVKSFQNDHKLKVTGTADVATLEAIYADELATPAPAVTVTPEPMVETTVTPEPMATLPEPEVTPERTAAVLQSGGN